METKSTDTSRYQELIKELDISIRKFEKNIDVPYSTIATAIRRNSNVTSEIADKITTRYPWVNMNWLIKGEGTMRLDGIVNENSAAYSTPPRGYEAVSIAAGKLSDNDKLNILRERLLSNDAGPKDVNTVLLIMIRKLQRLEQIAGIAS